MRPLSIIWAFFVPAWLFLSAQPNQAQLAFQKWTELPGPVPDSQTLGLAGAISGHHHGAIIVAGGANFPQPYWASNKAWHKEIQVFLPEEDRWLEAGELPHPLAYAAVVSTQAGVIAMGGTDGASVFEEVHLLQWNPANEAVEIQALPSLPAPCAYGSASLIGTQLYLLGGTSGLGLESAMRNVWRLDVSRLEEETLAWEELPAWPGPERAFAISVSQHNGRSECLYLLSGRKVGSGSEPWEVLRDAYEFSPQRYANDPSTAWKRIADLPAPRMAGTAIPMGQSHLFVIGGADGSLYQQSDQLRETHPGFPKEIFAYHTITDRWFSAGEMPENLVTSHAFPWKDGYLLASGEIKPRIRSPHIWQIRPKEANPSFGWLNGLTLLLYLLILVGIGLFFARRTRNTDDFFRGGQRIPWWAAGCSIFATMLSSLTFMSIPAKAYATDWLYFPLNLCIIAVAPFLIHFILPYFRQLSASSAYEYLETRFHVSARLFASFSYLLFQLGRMAIVMFLPALALASVTSLSVETCILLMGGISLLYSTLGGVEAIVWTDTLQTVVLLGGALLSLGLILMQPEIGWHGFVDLTSAQDKFRMLEWDHSYTGTGWWVVILGGLGQALIPYTSDQGVVQRYLSVSDEKQAARSIWTNAGLSLVASVLFFGLGTALYVYFSQHPADLSPQYQTDAVFPLFIAQQLPVGLAGLVIAGIFAAAQSTVSTSMHSMATAFSTDVLQRFGWLQAGKELRVARMLTLLFGALGTISALLLAQYDLKSLWDVFLQLLGVMGGAMCGLFLLGIFFRRANAQGAMTGAIGGAITVWLVQQYTLVSFLLYGSLGIVATVVIGWGASRILGKRTA